MVSNVDKISILVPVYNSDKYLKKCVESILNQTYENIELILVNDGSTDTSYELIEQFKIQDKRVKAVHIENNGVANARNIALDNATGDYFLYVDSDDWIEQDYIEELYNLIIQEKADICIGNCVHYIENTNSYIHKDFGIHEKRIYNKCEAVEELMYHNFLRHSPWGKLYKKQIFDGMRFPTGYHYEDLALIYKLFFKAEKIIYTPMEKYIYMVREGSIVHRELSQADVKAILQYSEEIVEFLEKEVPQIIDSGKYLLLINSIKIIESVEKNETNKVYINKAMSNLKKYRKDVISNKKVSYKYKMLFIISYFGIHVLKLSLKIKKVIKK